MNFPPGRMTGADVSDEDILRNLLALNLERSGSASLT
jgi:hypothetical protein